MKTTSRSTQLIRLIAIGASLATMALALAGFGSALASGGSAATAKRSKSVAIQGFVYKPGTMHVKAGTKVIFANKEKVPHTATGKGFDTGVIAGGSSKSITFGKKGTFAYHCTLHPEMHGKVIVE